MTIPPLTSCPSSTPGTSASVPHGDLAQVESFLQQAEPTPANPIRIVLRALRGRWLLAGLACMSFGVVFALVGYRATRPSYQTSGLVRVSPIAARILYQNDDNQLLPMFESFATAQISYLKSRPVLERALMDSRLAQAGWSNRPDDLVRLGDALKVERKDRSELITVSAQSIDSMIAMSLVNAVLDAYEDIYGENAEQKVSVKEQRLFSRESELESQLKDIDRRMLEIGHEHGIESIVKAHERKLAQLEEKDQKLVEIGGSIAQQEGSDAKGASIDAGDAGIIRLTVLDQAMADLMLDRARRSAALVTLRDRYQDSHPKVRQLSGEIVAIEQAIQERREQLSLLGKTGVLSGTGMEEGAKTVDQLKQLRTELEGSRNILAQEAVDLNRKKLLLSLLADERGQIRSMLEEIRRGLEQVRVESRSTLPGRIEVAVRASAPTKPIADMRVAFAAGGGAAGIVLGLLSVVLMSMLQQRVRYSEDLDEFEHRAPRLAVLPDLKQVAPVGDDRIRRGLCDLRNQLQLRSRGGARRVIAVTSIGDGAGRTTVATGLAEAFAISGMRTAIIDADWLQSKVTEHYSLGNTKGLRDAIGCDRQEVEQHAVGTNKLWIVPIGQDPAVADASTSWGSLQRVLSATATDRDVIIIDAGNWDAQLTARLTVAIADQTLFVIPRGQALSPVRTAIGQIHLQRPGQLFTVVNCAAPDDPALPSVVTTLPAFRSTESSAGTARSNAS